MGRWIRLGVMMVAGLLLLSGCVMPPGRYGYSGALMVGAPQVAFTFDDGIAAYYESAYGVYVYEDNGVYYRWTNGAWVYAADFGGPWAPVVGTVYLPRLLVYGPPPPIVRYRPYFVWWRGHYARWYAIHHPHWWYRHRLYMRSYPVWRAHVARFYARHPGHRPAMRPFFRQRGPRFDRGGPPPRVGRGPGDRFQGPGPGARFQGPGPRAGFQGPRRYHPAFARHQRPGPQSRRRDRRGPGGRGHRDGGR